MSRYAGVSDGGVACWSESAYVLAPSAYASGAPRLGARVSRAYRVGERVQVEGLAEAFNTLNHRNNLTKHGAFGAGAYPTNPSATFGQVTAVNDPCSLQLALRVRF